MYVERRVKIDPNRIRRENFEIRIIQKGEVTMKKKKKGPNTFVNYAEM